MKIITILFLSCFLIPMALFAQEPVKNREDLQKEQAMLQAREMRMQDLEEQRLRLDKAIVISDAESAVIMKQEILQRMQTIVKAGLAWKVQTEGIFSEGNPGQRMVERMQVLLQSFETFNPYPHTEAVAREANSIVSEFIALTSRAPF